MQLPPTLALLLTPNRTTIVFAVKGVIAMALSLYVAMYLNLDRPYWALVSAVFLQMRPESGLVIEKGICQIVGSVIGGAAGILILNWFTGYPLLAIGSLAVWVFLMSAGSVMVHRLNFIYGFAMAAMTASLVVVLVMANAANADSYAVFEVAQARMSEISVGAVCATLVSLLLWPVQVKNVLRVHARNVINRTLDYLVVELDPDGTHVDRHKQADGILESLGALSDDSSAVVYEGPEGSSRARAADLLCNKVLSLLAVVQIFGRLQRNHGELLDAKVAEQMRNMREHFKAMAKTTDYNDCYHHAQLLRRELLHFRASYQAPSPILARLTQTSLELVADLVMVLKAYDALENSQQTRLNAPSLSTYRDPLVAAITGFRTMVVFLIGAAIWINTTASAAVMMMILPLTFSVMFARFPSPTFVLARLLVGVLLAIPVGLYFGLGLMAQGAGHFALLVIAMGGPLFIGLMALANRPTLPYGLGFCIPFVILIQPSNTMTYAVDNSLSVALGIFAGVSVLYWVFKLITAPDSILVQKRLIRSTAHDLATIGHHRHPEGWFNGRMGDRLMRLAGYEQGTTSGTRYLTDLGLTGLNLGHVSIRLRRQLATSHDPRVHALLEQWQQSLADTFLCCAKGHFNADFRARSQRLVEAVRKTGAANLQVELIEGTMERLALTFERTAHTFAEQLAKQK